MTTTTSWTDDILGHIPPGAAHIVAQENRILLTPPPPPPPRAWTDQELLDLPRDGRKYELIHGVLSMSPAGAFHGNVITRLIRHLAIHIDAHHLGELFDGQTGFRLSDQYLLSPDISFVSAARLKGLDHAPIGFFTFAPDLAIEVLSPSDRASKMYDRAPLLFAHGTRLLWVINPMDHTATVYHGPQAPDTLLAPTASLDGEQIIPGFSLPLPTLFAPYRF
jgi:Uma2 family endonuclease